MTDLSTFQSAPPTFRPNYMLIPVNAISLTDENVQWFNQFYQEILSYARDGIMTEFETTPSGGICTRIEAMQGLKYRIVVSHYMVDICVKWFNARYYRFQIGHRKAETSMTGHRAFCIYQKQLLKDGVDLKTLKINNGLEVKKTIPSPKIECYVAYDLRINHVYHLDLNSAYNTGMMIAFPELETTIRRLYNKRKECKTFKDVLNMTQGFMQSVLCHYQYAHISKAGYVYTVNKIDDLTKKIQDWGGRIVAHNTDGIWYQSKKGPYHDEEEGIDIGQWKTDHYDCTIRFKSKGCYEYIEDGVYTPVVRGLTSYDKVKPRSEWEWGDIYRSDVIQYSFVEGEGFVKHE